MLKNKITIYIIGFLFFLPIALTSYINSSLLEQYVKKDYVGLIYAVASILTIIGLFKIPKVLNRFGNRKTTIIFSGIVLVTLLFLAFGKTSIVILSSFILYFAFSNFIVSNLDVFVEKISPTQHIGKTRGLYLSVINLSWVIAQFISGSIIEKSSFTGIYLFAALFMILVIFVLNTNLHNFMDPKYKKVSIKKTALIFLKDKNLLRIYSLSLIIKLFYSWMIIYTTFYLHNVIGFGWKEIGIIYSFMLIPFVILSYPLGKLSDKIGEKEFLIFGFIVTGLATLIFPFIKVKTVFYFALILFLTRIGAAIIEVMSESYFFKKINQTQVDEIEFFRTTWPFSYIVGPILATLCLLFIPSIEYLFYILGTILFIGIIISLRLKDTN